MNSKPNIAFGMHIFQPNTGDVTVSGETDKINGFTRCTIRQLLLGVNTSRRFLENWQERTLLLQYLKRSNDLWQLTKINAKMNTGERWCESLWTEINSLKMGSRGGLTRTLFTDVSEGTLPKQVIDIYADDGRSKFLWNGGTHLLQVYKVSRPRIQ